MYNKVIMIGRIGTVEHKLLPSNTAFTKLSLAVNKRYKKDGVKQETTTWWNIHAYAKTAELMNDLCKVGQLIMIEGELKQEKYTDKAGIEKISTVVIPDIFNILSDKNKDSSQTQEKPVKVEQPVFHDDDMPW